LRWRRQENLRFFPVHLCILAAPSAKSVYTLAVIRIMVMSYSIVVMLMPISYSMSLFYSLHARSSKCYQTPSMQQLITPLTADSPPLHNSSDLHDAPSPTVPSLLPARCPLESESPGSSSSSTIPPHSPHWLQTPHEHPTVKAKATAKATAMA